jgi:predicted transcriptional regulator of viral defense system
MSPMWHFVDIYSEVPTIHHMAQKSSEKVLRLARRHGSVSRQTVYAAGIHTQALSRMVRDGALERVAPGQYRVPDAPVTEHHGLAVVAAAAPKAVVCLLSALSFHQIGTQLPHAIWIAIDRRARSPTLSYPPLHVVRFSGMALTEGIETHEIEGQIVQIFSVAKTIADLFKYRNKIGLDIALEALRDAWRARRFTMTEIHRYARVCRVERVMAPYLEALVS